MEQLLISRLDIEGEYALSANISQNKIDPHILRAQRFDIRPLIGSHCYYELQKALAQPAPVQRWIDLFDGVVYKFNNRDIYFLGVKKALISYAYARIIGNNNFNPTRAGNKTKQTPESNAVTVSEEMYKAVDAHGDALAYGREITRFLTDNCSTYPEYSQSLDANTGQKTSLGIFNASKW